MLRPMITRLDHIQITMPPGQEDEARKFFSGLLEMAEEAKPPAYAVRGGCWFRQNGVLVHVSVEPAGFAAQKRAHPAFCVRDLDALCRRLSAAGFPIIPETTLPDRRRVYTADPFGNRIELIQDGDGFGQR